MPGHATINADVLTRDKAGLVATKYDTKLLIYFL